MNPNFHSFEVGATFHSVLRRRNRASGALSCQASKATASAALATPTLRERYAPLDRAFRSLSTRRTQVRRIPQNRPTRRRRTCAPASPNFVAFASVSLQSSERGASRRQSPKSSRAFAERNSVCASSSETRRLSFPVPQARGLRSRRALYALQTRRAWLQDEASNSRRSGTSRPIAA
jgi:hypothetical protein